MEKFVQGVDDKVIAKIKEQSNTTEGGIIIPETAENEPQLYCDVISVGENVGAEINPGDTILVHRNGGMDIIFKREIYKVLKYDEIYGVLKDA